MKHEEKGKKNDWEKYIYMKVRQEWELENEKGNRKKGRKQIMKDERLKKVDITIKDAQGGWGGRWWKIAYCNEKS